MNEVIEKYKTMVEVQEHNIIKPMFKLKNEEYTSGYLKYFHYPEGTKIIITIEVLVKD